MSQVIAPPAISVRDLWLVYGPDPHRALEDALSKAGDNARAAAVDLRTKGFVPAVCNASFDVQRGEIFVIMGLSGSGKSTMIRAISRLAESTRGSVMVDDCDILKATKAQLTELRRRKLGMVFQHFGLFPHMTVRDNVAFPLKMQGVSRAERNARAEQVLSLVDLSNRLNSFPRQLSGGQKQRVGIARSLAADPDIWFLDEPFSALDPLIRRQLQDEFLRIQASVRKSIVFITHDISEALKLADRIAIMKDGEIVQIGTPAEIVLNPVNSYVAEFSRDVPKAQHATVRSVMTSGQDIGPDDPGIREDMLISDALIHCMQLYQPVPVHNDQGKVIGAVHPEALAAALRSDDQDDAPEAEA